MLSRVRTLLVLVTLAAVALPAQAIVSRRSGGSVATDTQLSVIAIADDSVFLDTDVVSSLTQDTVKFTINSVIPYVYATPYADCFGSQYYTDPPSVPPPDGWEPEHHHTACDWVFEEDEQIQLQGQVDNYINGSVFELVWTITGNGKTWSWTGDDVSYDFLGNGGPVFLDVAMPDDMGIGQYAIDLAFKQWAPDGKTMYTVGHPGYQDPIHTCIDETELQCGWIVHEVDSWTMHGPSMRDTASFIVTAEVPEPGTLALLLLGGLLVVVAARPRLRPVPLRIRKN